MPDAALPVGLAQLGDDVVRRAARRLVDDDQAVSHRRPHDCAHDGAAVRARRGSRDEVVGVERGLEARGEPVAAATVVGGDRADVDVAERAQAHADRAVGLFLQHAGDLGLGGAAQDVDEPFDLLEGDVVALEHVLGDGRPHEAPLDVELARAPAPRRAA